MEETNLAALNDAAILLTDGNFTAEEFSEFLADAIAQLSECYILASGSDDLGCTKEEVQKTLFFFNHLRKYINSARDMEAQIRCTAEPQRGENLYG